MAGFRNRDELFLEFLGATRGQCILGTATFSSLSSTRPTHHTLLVSNYCFQGLKGKQPSNRGKGSKRHRRFLRAGRHKTPQQREPKYICWQLLVRRRSNTNRGTRRYA